MLERRLFRLKSDAIGVIPRRFPRFFLCSHLATHLFNTLRGVLSGHAAFPPLSAVSASGRSGMRMEVRTHEYFTSGLFSNAGCAQTLRPNLPSQHPSKESNVLHMNAA